MLVIAVVMFSLSAETIGHETFVALIGAAASTVEDIYLEYEGSFDDKLARSNNSVSGLYMRRHDGFFYSDRYERDGTSGRIILHSCLQVKDKQHTISRDLDRPTFTAATRKAKNFGPELGPFEMIWGIRQLLHISRTAELVDQGVEKIAGVPCQKIYVARGMGTEPPSFQDYFWICLDRDCQVMRHDHYQRGLLRNRVSSTLRQYDASDGKKIWIPTSGVISFFGTTVDDKKTKEGFRWIRGDEVCAQQNISVIGVSVRLNSGLPKEKFTLKRGSNRGYVSAAIHEIDQQFRAQTEPKHARKAVSVVEAEKKLDQLIDEMEQERNELKARSPARRGTRWWEYLPWIAAVVAVAGWAITYWRQRNG